MHPKNTPPAAISPPGLLDIIDLIRLDNRVFWILRSAHRSTPLPEHLESVFKQFDGRLDAIGRESWFTRPEKRRIREKLRQAMARPKSARRQDSGTKA